MSRWAIALVAIGAAFAASGAETPLRGGVTAVIGDGELELVGETELATRWKWGASGWASALRVWSLTTIEGSAAWTFIVRDLHALGEFRVEPPTQFGTARWGMLLGARDRSQVDRDGERTVGYLGVESWGQYRLCDWSAKLAALAYDRNIDAAALAGASVRCRPLQGKLVWGLSGWVDGLIGGADSAVDLQVGPELVWRWSDTSELVLFARYRRDRSPLGLDEDAALIGFELIGKPGSVRGETQAWGSAATGITSDGELLGRLLIGIATPGRWSWGLELDANAIGGEPHELFYFLTGGVRREWRSGLLLAEIYHRSSHQLSSSGEVRSTNFIEAGYQTAEWGAVPRRALDVQALLGWLVSSDFGADRDPLVRGGVRWAWGTAASRAWCGYALAQAEFSDAGRHTLGVGLIGSGGLDLTLAQTRDSQWFRRDKSLITLTLTRRW
jgi:hypothetical protein